MAVGQEMGEVLDEMVQAQRHVLGIHITATIIKIRLLYTILCRPDYKGTCWLMISKTVENKSIDSPGVLLQLIQPKSQLLV